jgi:steroid 5-alpha reductase family enzyme
MSEWHPWLVALVVLVLIAALTWLVSLPLRNVSIVDSVWSLLLLAAGIVYYRGVQATSIRSLVVLGLLLAWAIRLALHITVRNWGHGEDRRYLQIRARNQPHFEFKSLYLVFGLQALLAAMISLPLLPALRSAAAWTVLDTVGALLCLYGLVWESVGDWQLAQFKAQGGNEGAVMDLGLWRFSRHPNYFGESCVWWGFYLLALSAGGWWTAIGPVLMTFMLLKVSGVGLLEKDIGERRPAYRDYIRSTNAFLPGRPHR